MLVTVVNIAFSAFFAFSTRNYLFLKFTAAFPVPRLNLQGLWNWLGCQCCLSDISI